MYTTAVLLNNNIFADYKSLDPVQDAMGSMGRWQIIIALALSLINFPAAWRQLATNFLAPPSNFTCAFPSPMNANVSMFQQCQVEVSPNITETCTNFTYDHSVFRSTLVSEVIKNNIFLTPS